MSANVETIKHGNGACLSNFTQYEFLKFFNSFDTVVTDCEGVLWVDNHPIPGSVDVINLLRLLRKRIFFISNNSTKLREDLANKANRMEYNVSTDSIISTGYLIGRYLNFANFKHRVYLIGSKGLAKELESAHIGTVGTGPDVGMEGPLAETLNTIQLENEVGAVVVGFDEHFSYAKMLKAASYLNQKNCIFLATNTTPGFNVSSGLVIPGTGSILRAVECASGKEAIVIGKPDTFLAECLAKDFNIDLKRTLLIGDRLDTDILQGSRCGFQTLLVLTGATKYDVMLKTLRSKKGTKDCAPDYYLNSLGDMLPFLYNIASKV